MGDSKFVTAVRYFLHFPILEYLRKAPIVLKRGGCSDVTYGPLANILPPTFANKSTGVWIYLGNERPDLYSEFKYDPGSLILLYPVMLLLP